MWWVSIPSRSSNNPSRSHATETGISSGSYASQARDLTFFMILAGTLYTPAHLLYSETNALLVVGGESNEH